jgi:hypothetical protein
LLLQLGDVGFDADQRAVVILAAGQIEQLARVLEALVQVGQGEDDAFQGFLFLAQFLGARRVVPDARIFQRLGDFLQFRCLGIEVKDTSATLARARRDRRDGGLWR